MPEILGKATATAGTTPTHTVELNVSSEAEAEQTNSIEVPWTFSTPLAGNPELTKFTGTISVPQLGTILDNLSDTPPPITALHAPVLPALTNAIPLATCLAVCIGGAVTGPILDCIWQHRKSKNAIKAILDCLKSKGFSMAARVLPCAIDCVHKHPIH